MVSSIVAWSGFLGFKIFGLALGAANCYGPCILASALYSVLALESYPSILALYLVCIIVLTMGIVLMSFSEEIAQLIRLRS
jgi:hypothetical protein